jgi:diguanylate cyclase
VQTKQQRRDLDKVQPVEDEAGLPSVATLALRFSIAISLTQCMALLGIAALWYNYIPITDPLIRSIASFSLLAIPIALLIVFIPNFIHKTLFSLLQITEAIENVALGRLDIQLPEPQTQEAARMGTALTVMLRRLRASLSQLEKAAHEDSLTQLCNRVHFKSQVDPLLQSGTACAMLLLDLDRFKSVNDSIGHGGGDRLLALFAERARVVLNKYASGKEAAYAPTMARLGGDEFAICLSGIDDVNIVSHVAQRLLKAIEDPFNIDGTSINIGVSIGIAMAPQDGDNYELLTRNADLALFQAKSLGKRNFQFFNESLKRQALAKFTIESQLRSALERHEFEVYYQPQINAIDQQVICVEALVRWQHPTLGLLLPGKFIAVAEEFGLISEIGRVVLRQSVAQAAIWHQQKRALRVSVNVAASQLRQRDFCDHVRKLLTEFELPAWLLELELTETIAMQDTQDVQQQLIELRAMGISLAIDDFGTGYSNLGLLRRLEFDRLKIDRSFISGIETQEDARMIVSTILAMAHTMNVEIVAEGVETSRQATILAAAGCTILQGFLYSKPLPVAEFEIWWAAHAPHHTAALPQMNVA